MDWSQEIYGIVESCSQPAKIFEQGKKVVKWPREQNVEGNTVKYVVIVKCDFYI